MSEDGGGEGGQLRGGEGGQGGNPNPSEAQGH